MRRCLVLFGCLLLSTTAAGVELVVGSKKFTESVLLGELVAGVLRAQGIDVRHRAQIGGTRVLWEALTRGDIDLYPEYSGTLRQELLRPVLAAGADDAAVARALAARGLAAGPALGFANNYALVMRADTAAALGITRIGDLARHGDLRLGFSNEFMARADGWPALARAYGLRQAARGLDHDLAYRALASGTLDVTDAYTTDAELVRQDLRLLGDDRGFFTSYAALVLYRRDAAARVPGLVAALQRLAGRIDEPAMQAMNAAVKFGHRPEAEVAGEWLRRVLGAGVRPDDGSSRARRIWQRTREHLGLVGVSLAAALVTALPLGVLAARRPRLGALVLATSGVLQTVPSLALLVVMVPLTGIGAAPAIAALYLYSLLPVIRNTHAGLSAIPASLLEVADAMGLSRRSRLWRVELPLALPAVFAGIKTAAVINVGTATLGALVGAGGYGQPILTGVRLADTGLILEGALPAAVLALVAQAGFAALERGVTPRGLRL